MILNLIDENDPVLQTATEQFDFSNPPIDPFELATNLYDTMVAGNGIGIAAPQCGLPYRVFVMRTEPTFAVFNPTIVWASPEFSEMEEGCLSFPGLGIKVKRPAEIRARFNDPDGAVVTKRFSGLTARCFQHELDHLNGICFTSRVSKLRLDQANRKRKKLERKLADGRLIRREPQSPEEIMAQVATQKMFAKGTSSSESIESETAS